MSDKGSTGYVLHCSPGHPNGLKIRITGKYGGIEIPDGIQGFKMGDHNKTPEFLKMNPMGQIPTFQTPDGPLFESMAIARYVASKGSASEQLLGKTSYEQAVIDQWIHFCRSNFEGLYPLFAFAAGWRPYEEKSFNEALAKVEKAFTGLELSFNHHDRKFVVGNHVTLADIVIGTSLSAALKTSLDTAFFSKYPKVHAYLHRFFSEPNVQALIGPFPFVEKFTPPQHPVGQ